MYLWGKVLGKDSNCTVFLDEEKNYTVSFQNQCHMDTTEIFKTNIIMFLKVLKILELVKNAQIQ